MLSDRGRGGTTEHHYPPAWNHKQGNRTVVGKPEPRPGEADRLQREA
jgi:hypothetical protein